MPGKRGQKKMNAEQLAQRLELIRDSLAACMSTGDIEEHFAEEWKVDRRTIRGYMQKVREETRRVKLITMTSDQRAEAQNLVIEGIKRAIAAAWAKTNSKGASTPDLIAAQRGYEQLGKVYGVFSDRLELSGPGGGPIPVGASGLTEKLRKLEAEALKRKAAAT